MAAAKACCQLMKRFAHLLDPKHTNPKVCSCTMQEQTDQKNHQVNN